jgi:hypothetical protein
MFVPGYIIFLFLGILLITGLCWWFAATDERQLRTIVRFSEKDRKALQREINCIEQAFPAVPEFRSTLHAVEELRGTNGDIYFNHVDQSKMTARQRYNLKRRRARFILLAKEFAPSSSSESNIQSVHPTVLQHPISSNNWWQ